MAQIKAADKNFFGNFLQGQFIPMMLADILNGLG